MALFIINIIIPSNIVLAFSILITPLSIIILIVLCRNIKEKKEYIKGFCVKCNMPATELIGKTTEHTGESKKVYVSRPGVYYTQKVMRENKQYKCRSCGHETVETRTFLSEEYT